MWAIMDAIAGYWERSADDLSDDEYGHPRNNLWLGEWC